MNTQSKPAQSEQAHLSLNDLHLAFANSCIPYRVLITAGLDVDHKTDRLQRLADGVGKLDAITKQLLRNACGAIGATDSANFPPYAEINQPFNQTPTLVDLHHAFADVCYWYGALVIKGRHDECVIYHLQYLAGQVEQFDTITKQLLSNACGGAE